MLDVLMYVREEWKDDLKLYIGYNNGFMEGVILCVMRSLLFCLVVL